MNVVKFEPQESREAAAAAGAWDPCFVDPWRGVAHFDGITIEADPITSARPDRVLPCIADEQVFFCRMLRRVVDKPKGRTALDFGTGSGVLAIAGAGLGLEVTGIDICERAITFAEYNKRQNRAVIGREGGNVTFERADGFGHQPPVDGAYDYIFLNPPFAPVPEDCDAPACVSAGDDGQRFLSRELLERAYELLKPGGSLLAVHLLLVNESGAPERLIASLASQTWSSLRVLTADGRMPLNQLRSTVWGSSGPAKDDGLQLTVAFIQLKKPRGVGASLPVQEPEILRAPIEPPTTWSERLKLHKAVFGASPRRQLSESTKVSGSVSQRLFPSGEFFLGRSTPVLDPVEVADASEHPIERTLLRWIHLNGILADSAVDATAFDVVMVEAAPWYLGRNSNVKLRSSTSIACRVEADSALESAKTRCENALAWILAQIGKLNDDHRSIFRHPDQQRIQTGHWHAAIGWHRELDTTEMAASVADALVSRPVASAGKPLWLSDGNVGAALRAERLVALDVPEENPSTYPFDDCIDTALGSYTAIMTKSGLLAEGPVNCYLIALPLPPTRGVHNARISGAPAVLATDQSPATVSPTAATLGDEKLTGFIYVYGWSRRPWSPAAEGMLADLARIGALMHEEAYANAAEKELHEKWYEDTMSHTRHELWYAINAIRPGMSVDAAKLLRWFMQGHLAMQDLADVETGLGFLHRLTHNTTETMTKLWCDSYAVRQLAHAVSSSSVVGSDLLAQWRAEAANLVRTAIASTVSNAPFQGFSDQEKIRRFYAAVLAALSNSAKHILSVTKHDGVDDKAISFNLHGDMGQAKLTIDCDYTYSNSKLADIVFRAGKKKLEFSASDSLARIDAKTEAVLKLHATRYLGANEVRIEHSFLSVHMLDDGLTVRWRCALPLPMPQARTPDEP